jgi:predicted nucleic-acid-binding Zn-ribbon protein
VQMIVRMNQFGRGATDCSRWSYSGLRAATATATTFCAAMKIGCNEMIRVMHKQCGFSDLFLKFLLARGKCGPRPISS